MLAISGLLRAATPSHSQQRSPSIVAALLRLRSQLQRLPMSSGTPSSSGPAAEGPVSASAMGALAALGTAPATPQAAIAAEARRLLRGEVRATDPLSDVAPTASNYCVEVGKLLSAAAAFGASTDDARVADCLDWVARHADEVPTTRSLMSICAPILNLRDGASAGRVFVLRYMLGPLQQSLTTGPGARAAAVAAHTQHQQRSAVMSVYALCARLLEVPPGAAGTRYGAAAAPSTDVSTASAAADDETAKVLALLAAATDSLVAMYAAGGATLSPAELSEAVHCVRSLHLAREAAASMGDAGAAARAQVGVMDVQLQAVLHAAVSPHGLRSTAGTRRPQDVVHLLDALVQLRAGDSVGAGEGGEGVSATDQGSLAPPAAPATAASASDALLMAVLAALPGAVSSASVRDLCALALGVNRVRSAAGLSPAVRAAADATLPPLLHALRPRLHSLAEAPRGALNAAACSQLVSALSRWEGVGGGGAGIASTSSSAGEGGGGPRLAPVRGASAAVAAADVDGRSAGGAYAPAPLTIPHDVLTLLCEHMGRDMAHVEAGQLVPFLQGLARLEVGRQRARRASSAAQQTSPSRGSAGTVGMVPTATATAAFVDGVLQSTVPAAAAVIEACGSRAVQLSRCGRLPAWEGAQAVGALAQLRAGEALAVFEAVEPSLAALLVQAPSPPPPAAAAPLTSAASLVTDSVMVHDETVHRRACGAVLQSLEALDTFGVAVTTEDAAALARARQLRARFAEAAARGVEGARTPRELVALFSTLHPTSTGGAVEGVGQTLPSSAPEATVPAVAATPFPAEAFMRRAAALAGQCGGYEVAQLALAVAQLARADPTLQSEATAAMRALLQRAATLADRLRLGEFKRLLDAARMVAGSAPPPSTAQDGEDASVVVLLQALAAALAAPIGEGPSTRADPALREVVALSRTLAAWWTRTASAVSATSVAEVVAALATRATAAVRLAAGELHADALVGRWWSAVPLLEQLVVLAYVSAQLSSLVVDLAGTPAAAAVTPEVEESAGPTHEEEEEGVEEGEEEREEEGLPAGPSTPAAFVSDATHVLLAAIADTVRVAVESRRAAAPGEGGDAVAVLSGKQLVMLVQSFEMARVASRAHRDLLFVLLPELRALAGEVGPLEVSLLMNAMARLGVWNARVMDALAAEAVDRVGAQCTVRECCTMLRGMQRSGFLPTTALLSPALGGTRARGQPGPSPVGTLGSSREDPLLTLSHAAVGRLDGFVAHAAALPTVLADTALEDLAAAVHVLGYFACPPQPTFDTYYALTMRKLILAVRALDQTMADTALHHHSAHGLNQVAVVGRLLRTMTLLGSRAHQLRRADHQRVASRALAGALQRLEMTLSRHPRGDIDGGGGDNDETRERTVLERAFASLPLRTLAEFHSVCRVHRLLYGPPRPRGRARRSPAQLACVDAFFAKLPRAPHALPPLRVFWRVLAPLPRPPRSDVLVAARCPRRLVMATAPIVAAARSLPAIVALCECLAQCLCSGACTEEEAAAVRAQLTTLLRREEVVAEASPAQAAALLLALSLTVTAAPTPSLGQGADDVAGRVRCAALCTALQRRPLLLRNAVDALLAFALLTEAAGGWDGVMDEGSAGGLRHAAQSLVPHLGGAAASSGWAVPLLYRLALAKDAAFIRMCVAAQRWELAQTAQAAVPAELLWDVLLRLLLAVARADSVAAVERRRLASMVLAEEVQDLARAAGIVRDVVDIAKQLNSIRGG